MRVLDFIAHHFQIPLLFAARRAEKVLPMNFQQILAALLEAYFTGQATFRVGSFSIEISTTQGTPVHLTLGAVFVAAEAILAGQTGSFQAGEILVRISSYTAPASIQPGFSATSLATSFTAQLPHVAATPSIPAATPEANANEEAFAPRSPGE